MMSQPVEDALNVLELIIVAGGQVDKAMSRILILS